jgi:uncharacterized DUF497 family protein
MVTWPKASTKWPSPSCSTLHRTRSFFDEDHSSDEERFLMLGMSSGAKLLIVCHCEREHGEVIRIISARKATKREGAFYRGGQA